MNTQIIVEDPSQVGEARRTALQMATRLSIGAPATDQLALAVTEAATNLVKHGTRGRILLAPLADDCDLGIEVLAIDGGPGMTNVAASMRDGYSTAGSPGLGLGSISRVASNLDIYSQRGIGTVLRFEIWTREHRTASAPVHWGGVCVASAGESVAGDAWSVDTSSGRCRLLVVDGLGHGPDAAAAAQTALRATAANPTLEPAAALEYLHDALHSTRGAAGAMASVTPHANTGVFAGVGNIGCFVRTPGGTRSLASYNGTLGHQMRKVRAFNFEFPRHALLFMHSDGIGGRWRLDQYPGLESHHPAVIAATVYRDHARARDDATVVVLRNEANPAP